MNRSRPHYSRAGELLKSQQAAELALGYHQAGYNCAESVLKAYCELESLAPDQYVKFATGFGGGGGESGCICGALAGATIAIGIRYGRVDSKQDKKPAYTLTAQIHKIFKEKYRSTCCRVLQRPYETAQDRRSFCDTLTAGTAEALFAVISEYEAGGQNADDLQR